MRDLLFPNIRSTQFFSKIIKAYKFYSWKKLFTEMRDQLAEIDEALKPVNKEGVAFDNFEDDDKQRKRKQAKLEPQLDFVIENKVLQIDYENI